VPDRHDRHGPSDRFGHTGRTGTVTVVGVLGDTLDTIPEQAVAALRDMTAVAGGNRHIKAWRDWETRTRQADPSGAAERDVREILISDDAAAFAREVAGAATADGPVPARVVVLASGDPGFFGVLRSLCEVIDREHLLVLPATSSVSAAFARLGLPWDDAVVVSAHGRALADAVALLRSARKAAVLTSPDQPPEAVGKALAAWGAHPDLVAVCSRLGCVDESVTELDLDSLASGTFDPLSVVVILGPGGLPGVGYRSAGDPKASGAPLSADRVLAWGLPESAFQHRGEMVTKAEVRAVALGKLELPASGVLWDIGAGSASVSVECALLAPGLTVFAVESEPDDASRAAANASAHGVAVHVIEGRAPEVLERLPDPDRVFVGGGGIEVLDAVLARLRPGGKVVATFAALERAAAAADRLGSLVQVSAARGSRLAGGGWRLSGANPVFVTWGPES
jgi:precorrin-6Y C5,15-methyltransferase (decarboxylating)